MFYTQTATARSVYAPPCTRPVRSCKQVFEGLFYLYRIPDVFHVPAGGALNISGAKLIHLMNLDETEDRFWTNLLGFLSHILRFGG